MGGKFIWDPAAAGVFPQYKVGSTPILGETCPLGEGGSQNLLDRLGGGVIKFILCWPAARPSIWGIYNCFKEKRIQKLVKICQKIRKQSKTSKKHVFGRSTALAKRKKMGEKMPEAAPQRSGLLL